MSRRGQRPARPPLAGPAAEHPPLLVELRAEPVLTLAPRMNRSRLHRSLNTNPPAPKSSTPRAAAVPSQFRFTSASEPLDSSRPGGTSSVGRAQASQAWGREFESRVPLQDSPCFLLDRRWLRSVASGLPHVFLPGLAENEPRREIRLSRNRLPSALRLQPRPCLPPPATESAS